MIAEIRLIHKRLFSVNLGLRAPAKTTFNKSETSTNAKQVPKTINLYWMGLLLSSAVAPMAAVQANQNKKTIAEIITALNNL